MINICLMLSDLALLTAAAALTVAVVGKKRIEKMVKAVPDYASVSCGSASTACERYTDESVDRIRKEFRELLYNLDSRIAKLESGAVPDYEKASAAAKAVNDFSDGLAGIFGYDPVKARQKMRQDDRED